MTGVPETTLIAAGVFPHRILLVMVGLLVITSIAPSPPLLLLKVQFTRLILAEVCNRIALPSADPVLPLNRQLTKVAVQLFWMSAPPQPGDVLPIKRQLVILELLTTNWQAPPLV